MSMLLSVRRAAALAATVLIPGAAGAGTGPDVTLCSLDSLRQSARSGSSVGVAAATTSWNVGDRRLDWHEQPDARHPFIVLNVYRIAGDRFEQIGQSWVKHGFYALSSSQCGQGCKDQTDGTELGVDCTDTYGSELNSNPLFLGPRWEVNPWTGAWNYAGSHFSSPHAHTPMDHQLRLEDADLDPATNAGATYLLEAYYVHYQDVNVMNSAAWKTFKVEGAPGGLWHFAMSGEQERPTVGFALDAWKDAQRTVVASEQPVQESLSPDGRVLLAAKATQQGPSWRYVYVLANVDMDRQVGGFEVPVGGGGAAQPAFHAPAHHGEALNSVGGVAIDNAAWPATVKGGTVSWSTSTNPIRWGTAYTFSFSSDRAPAKGTVTLRLFKAGAPATLTASTVVPQP